MTDTKLGFAETYITEDSDEFRERRKQQAIEAQKYIQENSLSK